MKTKTELTVNLQLDLGCDGLRTEPIVSLADVVARMVPRNIGRLLIYTVTRVQRVSVVVYSGTVERSSFK